jgi:uncharacterized membrane protein YkoI
MTVRRPVRIWFISGALAVGAVLGAAGIAAAATDDSSSGTSTSTAAGSTASGGTAAPDPAKVAHGPGETLLTGTTAAKVKAAALAAVPGSTVIRVETDSAGSPYEAHLTKSDGSQVTVKIDSNFKVTATESGFGPGNGRAGGGPTR